MTNTLVRLFVKNSEDVRNLSVRESYGRLAGVVGILSNFLLFALKLFVGLATGSISITADAINNLSDCASSGIVLVGFKLSSMPADEKHPYGHARYEYISGLVVSFLIMLIGVQFLQSSIKKIISPEAVEFSAAVVIILLLSVLVKLWQGMFNKKIGARIDSGVLVAAATDSVNDVITTLVVLLGAVISYATGLNLDGFMGLLVAGFILFSGVNLVKDTLNPLLGMAPDEQLVKEIEDKIKAYPSVMGLHDLFLHNYGPGRCFASVHVEIPATQDILVSHDIIDDIERSFALDMGIVLVIHLDPIVVDDEKTAQIREFITAVASDIDPTLSVHDFRMVSGAAYTNLIFDVVVKSSYKYSDRDLRKQFVDQISSLGEQYFCVIKVDRNYTSTINQHGKTH